MSFVIKGIPRKSKLTKVCPWSVGAGILESLRPMDHPKRVFIAQFPGRICPPSQPRRFRLGCPKDVSCHPGGDEESTSWGVDHTCIYYIRVFSCVYIYIQCIWIYLHIHITYIYIYTYNGCFTKHPFINGCLGFQVYLYGLSTPMTFPKASSPTWLLEVLHLHLVELPLSPGSRFGWPEEIPWNPWEVVGFHHFFSVKKSWYPLESTIINPYL